MKYTSIMKNREEKLEAKWRNEGDGYYSLKAIAYAPVCYVALPSSHRDVGADYCELHPRVNGGLTFGMENVFGWDYGHMHNDFDFNGDIRRAIRYFKERENSNMLLVE